MSESENKTEKSAASSKPKKEKATKTAAAPTPVPFAVIRTGGKQYRVSPGDKISVEKIESEEGSNIAFDDVLLAGMTGQEGAKILTGGEKSLGVKVTGKVLGQTKSKKVIIFKKRRRGGYTKKQGHRQQLTEVLIQNVAL